MRKYGIPVLFGALVTTTFAGLAQAQVIDSFEQGGGTYFGCGLPSYQYFAGAGPIGERRELYMRDGHSSCSARIEIDDVAGTVEFWSNVTAPQQVLQYGTLIGSIYPGFGQMSPNTGEALNLSFDLDDAFEIDVDQLTSGAAINVLLRTGAGDFAWSGALALGTNRVLLADFTGLTSQAAADIDGIRIEGAVNAAQGSGLIFSEARLVELIHAALVQQTSIGAGNDCADGGIRVEMGTDNGAGAGTADDGVLHADEVTSTEYVCNGADGEDGTDGVDGQDGEDGTDGVDGQDGEDGTDGVDGQDGEDGEDGEDGTDGVDGQDGEDGADGQDGGDGVDGYNSLITTSVLNDQDQNCAEGGIRIDVGLDNGDSNGTARDSILQAGEIDQTRYVCNGATGSAGTDGADGEDGTNGADGADGEDGVDGTNGDAGPPGAPGADGEDGEEGENGADGATGAPGSDGEDGDDGKAGADGISAVLRLTTIEKGSALCEAGGVRIEGGPDLNGNGTLDDDEVQAESKACSLNPVGGDGCTVSTDGPSRSSTSLAGILTLMATTLVFRRRARSS